MRPLSKVLQHLLVVLQRPCGRRSGFSEVEARAEADQSGDRYRVAQRCWNCQAWHLVWRGPLRSQKFNNTKELRPS
jgi:hypothetical protein